MKKFFLTLTLLLPILAVLVYPTQIKAFNLTITINPTDSGSVTQTGPDANSIVTLTAVPNYGYKFKNWGGSDLITSPNNPINITMDSNKQVTANFQSLTFDPPRYPPPDCGDFLRGFDPACWLPVNVSKIPQIKLGPLSVGSPSLGGLIVDAGAYIRGNLILPLPSTPPLTPAEKATKVGNVLTLMGSDGTAGWAPLSLDCVTVVTTTPETETAQAWKTATTTACEAGYRVTGGGIKSSPDSDDPFVNEYYDSIYSESYKDPVSEAWVGRLRGEKYNATVYARCCKLQ